jgi:SAM-dependent methyltransferase
MSDQFSYQHYVTDQTFLDEYNAYQAKYATQMRESDKVLISLIGDYVESRKPERRTVSLLDIGCSTGNLLLHLKRLMPSLDLTGGDLAESSLQECRANPDLEGVIFKELDLLKLPKTGSYDIITINAVLYMMEDGQLEEALRSVACSLKPGGLMIAFDFFHPYTQDLHILEVSKSHPAGLRLRFRPISMAINLLSACGFVNPIFRPFTLPIDLPASGGADDLITYTVPALDGRKLPFRGTLFQPWCHLSATRASSE